MGYEEPFGAWLSTTAIGLRPDIGQGSYEVADARRIGISY
jgi:hypothetical protein